MIGVGDIADSMIESVEFDSNIFGLSLDDHPTAGPQSILTRLARPSIKIHIAGIPSPVKIAPAGDPHPYAKDVLLIAGMTALAVGLMYLID